MVSFREDELLAAIDLIERAGLRLQAARLRGIVRSEAQRFQASLRAPVSALPIWKATLRRLEEMGIRTVDGLVGLTSAQIESPGVGPGAIENLRERLAWYGLHLADDDPGLWTEDTGRRFWSYRYALSGSPTCPVSGFLPGCGHRKSS